MYESDTKTLTLKGSYDSGAVTTALNEYPDAENIVFAEDAVVTNGASLFMNKSNIKQIDFSKMTTRVSGSNMTSNGYTYASLISMFRYCTNLEYVNLGTAFKNVAGTNAKDKYGLISYMFQDCKNLKKIDGLDNLDFDGITGDNMQRALSFVFDGCESLEYIDISHLMKEKNINKFLHTFRNCKNLETVVLGTTDISAHPNASEIDFTGMFEGCEKLQSIDFSGLTSKNANSDKTDDMFKGCSGLTSIIFGKSIGNVKNSFSEGAPNLTRITFKYTGSINGLPNSNTVYAGWVKEGDSTLSTAPGETAAIKSIPANTTYIRVPKTAGTYKPLGSDLGYCIDYTNNGDVFLIYHPSITSLEIASQKYNHIELYNKSNEKVDFTGKTDGGVEDGELRTLYTSISFPDKSSLSAADIESAYVLAIKLSGAQASAPASNVKFELVEN